MFVGTMGVVSGAAKPGCVAPYPSEIRHWLAKLHTTIPSQLAAFTSNTVYHTKVLLYKGIIVKGIIHTKVLLNKGIIRN